MRLVNIADRNDFSASYFVEDAHQILAPLSGADSAHANTIVGAQDAPVRSGGCDRGADESAAIGFGHDEILPMSSGSIANSAPLRSRPGCARLRCGYWLRCPAGRSSLPDPSGPASPELGRRDNKQPHSWDSPQ